jgi:AmmeMemoRadiSam system protein A
MAIQDKDRETLLSLARAAIAASVGGAEIPRFDLKSPVMREICGVFVTLHKDGKLRGCIGNFDPCDALYQNVTDMAVAAATQDRRFDIVTTEELADIKIEISVLSPLRKITDVEEIEIGKHGIYMTKGRVRGVLLPQVAVEQGYNREEFLNATCEKAGLSPTRWKDGSVEIEIFDAEIFADSSGEG